MSKSEIVIDAEMQAAESGQGVCCLTWKGVAEVGCGRAQGCSPAHCSAVSRNSWQNLPPRGPLGCEGQTRKDDESDAKATERSSDAVWRRNPPVPFGFRLRFGRRSRGGPSGTCHQAGRSAQRHGAICIVGAPRRSSRLCVHLASLGGLAGQRLGVAAWVAARLGAPPSIWPRGACNAARPTSSTPF